MSQAQQSNSNHEVDTQESAAKRQIAIGISIGVLVGVILGSGGTFILQSQRIAGLKVQVEQSMSQSGNSDSNHQLEELPALAAATTKLLMIIKEQQRANVKESYGEQRSQNFSQQHLDVFKQRNMIQQITDKLKHNGEFLEVIIAIKQLPPGEEQKLLDQASKTFSLTWAELGRVSREGQTEAGQQAERMIAESIVELVKGLSKQSPESIKSMASE